MAPSKPLNPAGAPCSEPCCAEIACFVFAHALNGKVPLHCAVAEKEGLDVVEALLQTHPHGATVANQVRVRQRGVQWLVHVCV